MSGEYSSVNDESEVWLDITETLGFYQVSNLGNVRRSRPGKGTRIGNVLRYKADKDGYNHISLGISGKQIQRKVHRLVYQAFVGDIPDGMQINHRDGIKSNNHVSNLEIVTPLQNIRHSHAVGLSHGNPGERSPMSKLTNADVIEIRKLNPHIRVEVDEVAMRYGVSRSTIRGIVYGQTWRHLIVV